MDGNCKFVAGGPDARLDDPKKSARFIITETIPAMITAINANAFIRNFPQSIPNIKNLGFD